ncbi:MAG: TIGR00282 family metallophosphoesterase [Chloroflexi bacterium]|nr:TIGR00282 family metallophosphoesterase [Chloroflexota bacterium]
MKILMVGDVVGRPGRRAVRELLPSLRQQHDIDLVVANGENAAGGIGLTKSTADELFDSGVDVLTMGNHVWDQKDLIPCLDGDLPILRPLNFPPGVPGRGYLVRKGVLIVNLMGRTFMAPLDCPFRTMDRLLAELSDRPSAIVVDFHAEATSEKVALGRYLDGRVTAVVGTHTHVGTADARVFPGGTAFVTDLGMTGPSQSIIGDDIEGVINKFLTLMPRRISVGVGPPILNSVLIDVAEDGKAASIARHDIALEERA